jgi:SAM-dependent methyltransferase
MNVWWCGKLAIARVMNLDLTHCQAHYAQRLERVVEAGARWLDIGCGRQILPEWALGFCAQQELVRRARQVVGVDVDGAIREHRLIVNRVIGLGGQLPFANETFDLVTANMVMEHIPDPGGFLGDIRRVLRPGGRFLFVTPNFRNPVVRMASGTPDWMKTPLVWLMERRKSEDVFPTHYAINTREAVRKWGKRARLEVEELSVVSSSGFLDALGPLAWLETPFLKLISMWGGGECNPNLVVVLRRPVE